MAATTAMASTLPVSSNDEGTTTQLQHFELLEQQLQKQITAVTERERLDTSKAKSKAKSKYHRRSFFRASVTGDEDEFDANSRTSF